MQILSACMQILLGALFVFLLDNWITSLCVTIKFTNEITELNVNITDVNYEQHWC